MRLLSDIQQKLKVPKSQYNKFSEFYYRNAEDILEAVKPLLDDNTLVISDEIVLIGDRYYVKATARLVYPDGTYVQAVGWARETADRAKFDAAQLTGAASSYARKYALNGLFCIDDTRDADSQAPEPARPAPVKAPVPPAPSVAAKTAPQRTEAETRKLAAKERIMAGLRALKMVIGPKPRLDDCIEAVKISVGKDLMDDRLENLEAIGEALWAKLEVREA